MQLVQYKKAVFEKNKLILNDNITIDEWKELGQQLKQVEGSVQFWIGDWARFGDKKGYYTNPKVYDELEEITGLDRGTIKNYKSVAENIPSSLRRDDLSFSQHQEVAKLEPEEQKFFLQKAVDEDLTVRELRAEIRKTEIKEDIILPSGKYKIIYADPPWQYENSGFENSAESNYPTMTLQKICGLPIQDLCTDESVLFLWATNPLLKEAFDVMEAWEFAYKTNFAWIKDKARGWAWWAKSKHELILVGVKPKSGTPVKNYDSAFMEKRENKHSKKPEFVYEMIEDMFPDSKYIELFARNTREGWDGWGNQL